VSLLERSRISMAAAPVAQLRRGVDRVARTGISGLIAGGWKRLAFAMQRQLQSNWCWAACGASVSAFFNPASQWTQCSLVSDQTDQPDCCQEGSSARCNVRGYLDLVLQRTGNYAGTAQGPVGGNDIRSELARDRPVAARVAWENGGGHFVVITGHQGGATEMIEVEDPYYGKSNITLDDFALSYQGTGHWSHTYFTQ
jgi:hypothetical protein